MKSILKKLVSFILTVSLCMGFSFTAFAQEDINAEDTNDYSWELENIDGTESLLRWSYTNYTDQGLSINSSGKATMFASVKGYSGTTTKIIMYMYLQQYKNGGWTNLTSTQDTIYSSSGSKQHYYSTCAKGYTYRLRCSYYVYSGNNYEHIIQCSPNYSY